MIDRAKLVSSKWKPFVQDGKTYSLSHLNDYVFTVVDSRQQTRKIGVSFGDHCFTRKKAVDEENPSLVYKGSSRNPGYFCFERYEHSLEIREFIAQVAKPKTMAWNVKDENFAFLPSTSSEGIPIFYGIVFSLERVRGLAFHLEMMVRSAYPCRQMNTFGGTRFEHLVALAMENKRPKRAFYKNRLRPRLSN